MKFFGLMFVLAVFSSMAFASAYDAVPATFTGLSADTYRVATAPGDVACAATSSGDWAYQNAKLVEIRSNPAIFGGPGDVMSGDYYFDKILFDPIGLTGNGSTSLNGTYYQTANTALWAPRVFWKLAGRDCFNWDYLTYTPTLGYSEMIGVPSANANMSLFNSSGLWFSKYSYIGLPSGIQTIFFSEYAGTVGPSSDMWTTVGIPFIADNPLYQTIRFKPSDSSTPTLYYRGIRTSPAFVSYEPRFVSERGSVWLSIGTADVSFFVAQQIATPSFEFQSAGAPSSQNHTFATLITDTIDRSLQNRQNTLAQDEYPSQLSDPDTGGMTTSPLRAVEPGTTRGKNLYRIGGAEYAPFADYSTTDSQASGFTYTEKQAYWVGTTPDGVAYDSSASVRDVDVNKYSAMVHSAKFEGNDFGIPVCTSDLNASTPDDWASCSNITPRTDNHRLNVKFLNQDWIISYMQQPVLPLASSTATINGGQVKLAKESKYGIMNAMDDSILQAGYDRFLLLAVDASSSCATGYSVTLQNMSSGDQAVVCVDDMWRGVGVYSAATSPLPGRATLGVENRRNITTGATLDASNLTMRLNSTGATPCLTNLTSARIEFLYGGQTMGMQDVCPDPSVNQTFMGINYALYSVTPSPFIDMADIGTYNMQELRVYTPSSTVLAATPYSARLNEVSYYANYDGNRPAIVDVIDTATGSVIGQVQIDPGTTYTFTGASGSVKLHIYSTHRGIKGISSLSPSWAEMAIYSEEITLRDGQRYNLVSSSDPDKDFRVSLLWKNRDYAGAGSSTVADSLREIVVYDIEFAGKTLKGETFNFLNNAPAFQVLYEGMGYVNSSLPPAGCTCGALSTPNFVCNIKSNLTSAGTCFNVTAANVTILCNGHRITGDSASGAAALQSNQAFTRLYDCTITDFDKGIVFAGASNGTISNVGITAGAPMLVQFSDGNVFEDFSAISPSNRAIWLVGASGNRLSRFTAQGMLVIQAGADRNDIGTFDVYSPVSHPLWILGSDNNTIHDFNSTGNATISRALAMTSGIGNVIANSTLSSDYVVAYVNGIYTTMYNVTIKSQSGTGTLLLVTGSENTFYWNNFTSVSGLYINDTSGGNFYNATTHAGTNEGNIYANVMDGSVPVNGTVHSAGFPALYIGENRQYGAFTSGGMVWGPSVDYAPLTPSYLNSSNSTPGCVCGNLTTPNYVCNVTQDLASNGTCFEVQAGNVTIECNGHSITGNGTGQTYGVYSNQQGTRVLGCSISNYGSGIKFSGTVGGEISNSAIESPSAGNASFAVYLQNATGTTITGSRITENIRTAALRLENARGASITDTEIFNTAGGNGIRLAMESNGNAFARVNSTVSGGNGSAAAFAIGHRIDIVDGLGGSNNTFNDCIATVADGSYGIIVNQGSNGNAFHGLSVTTASQTAVSVLNGTDTVIDCAGGAITGTNAAGTDGVYSNQTRTTVRNCVISGYQMGVFFDNATYGALQNITVNTTYPSGQGAFLSTGSNYNTISNSSFTSATGNGLHLHFTEHNTITGTTASSGSTGNGMYIFGSTHTLVSGSTATSASTAGLRLDTGSSNTVANCIVNGNSGFLGALSIYSSESGSTVANSTIEGNGGNCTLGLRSAGSNAPVDNLFANNTFKNAMTLACLDYLAGNNTFYWNNFSGAVALYVNDSNGGNFYNTTLAGQGEGNLWADILDGTVNVSGTAFSLYGPGYYIGVSGNGYPYSNGTSAKVIGAVTDFAPLVLGPIIIADVIVTGSAGGSVTGTAYNVTVPATLPINATASAGNVFSGWSAAGNCTINNTAAASTTVYVFGASCNITAAFTSTGSGGGGGGSGGSGGGNGGGSVGGGGGGSVSSEAYETFPLEICKGVVCNITVTRTITSSNESSVMTTTIENIGGSACNLENFVYSDTLPNNFASVDELAFSVPYASRDGQNVKFMFSAFAPGESKTLTYTAQRWVPTSRIRSFGPPVLNANKCAPVLPVLNVTPNVTAPPVTPAPIVQAPRLDIKPATPQPSNPVLAASLFGMDFAKLGWEYWWAVCLIGVLVALLLLALFLRRKCKDKKCKGKSWPWASKCSKCKKSL